MLTWLVKNGMEAHRHCGMITTYKRSVSDLAYSALRAVIIGHGAWGVQCTQIVLAFKLVIRSRPRGLNLLNAIVYKVSGTSLGTQAGTGLMRKFQHTATWTARENFA